MRWLFGFFVFLAAISFTPPALAASEEILSFKSEIHINADASLTITETITVRALGKKIKRGIYRDFPTTYKDRFNNTVRVPFKVQRVTRNGQDLKYWVESRGDGKRVYMGSKDKRIRPDIHTFVLSYRTARQIGFFKDYDEIYWNVTGNDWAFPIKSAEAIVIIPPKSHVVQKSGYTGKRGRQGKEFTSFIDANGFIHFKTTSTLNPGEGLTVAVAWPKGFLPEPTTSEKAAHVVRDNNSVLVGLVGFLLVAAYYLFAWNRVGRDPAGGAVFPRFEPPDGFSPAAVNYLMGMGYDDKAFAAAIVNMAVKGYLRIEEKGGEFTLTRLKGGEAPLSSGEKTISEKLFRYHASVELKQENHKRIGETLKAFKKKLEGELEKIYFKTNTYYLIPGALLTVLMVIAMGFSSDNQDQGFIVIFMSVWLSGWTAGVYVILRKVVRSWKDVLGGGGILEIVPAVFISMFSLPFIGGEFVGLYMLSQAMSIVAAAFMLATICLMVVFYQLLKAPTLKGRKVMDGIEGFKLYLSVAEKDRLEALHPPQETPELFERFLPFALALGVEHQWSENFADVLFAAGQNYQPGWYGGRSWDRHGFSDMSDSLGNSLSNSLSSSAQAPGSSSGSGGGGFSGGGGGGGGGGGF